MYGYIYKVTNLINNKIYIGKHKYRKKSNQNYGLDTSYFASGKLINQAINKYGKDNFKQEILQYANNKVQ